MQPITKTTVGDQRIVLVVLLQGGDVNVSSGSLCKDILKRIANSWLERRGPSLAAFNPMGQAFRLRIPFDMKDNRIKVS